MEELMELKKRLYAELDNYVVKDTYTKGKISGFKKAIALIDDRIAELSVEK